MTQVSKPFVSACKKFQNTYFCRRSLLNLEDVLWTHWNIWWQNGDLGWWKYWNVFQGQCLFASSLPLLASHYQIRLWISICVKFTGVAVRGSVRDHPVFCGGSRFPHQEPSHLPQGHRGHYSQPGAPGWGLDGRLQAHLLSPQPQRCSDGQRGQCDLLTGC